MSALLREQRIASRDQYKLLEHEAFKLLERYGIPYPPYGLARTVEEAVRIANEIGFPVVLKIVSPDVVHKTDVGGVLLGLNNEEEVAKGFKAILNNVKTWNPNARIQGVLVQKMITSGVEVIIGGVRDPIFGIVIMFGLGGVFTEILRDVSFRVWPVSREDVLEMINEIKGVNILKGFRGQEPVSMYSIVDIVLRFGKLLEENPVIESADLNPIRVFSNGLLVIDARFIIKPA
ncbi:MAG: acetate--CoA ligase family protein [Desulfurococcaceae archaeon]